MEYMTMKQAFECGHTDTPLIENGFNNVAEMTKEVLMASNIEIPLEFALSERWQVKKAIQKVLTVDELIDGYVTNPMGRNGMGKFAVKCEQNGQLKEWNRSKELREAVEAWSKCAIPTMSTETDNLVKALKNLKPPY